MPTADYTFEFETEPGSGLPFGGDVTAVFEIVDASVSPAVRVDEVLVDEYRCGKKVGEFSLTYSRLKLHQDLAAHIANQIEDDERWCAARIDEAGYRYVGLGGNDPDGRMVHVREAV